MAGLYIHIPFCRRKCVYCDFYSTARFGKFGDSYLDAATREMEMCAGYLGGEPVKTLYFGGGTPSLYTPAQIGRLVKAARNIFGDGRFPETTVEVNPDDISAEYLAGIGSEGIDRLSIGIQSFDDTVLSFMKRRHSASQAEESVRLARRAGFGNISIDLIYGIPGLGTELWERTLDKALSLYPEHISAYHLTIEPSTVLGRWQTSGKVMEIPQEESRRQFAILHNRLTEAGYEHYEVSNFAWPGFRSRHNSSYWTGDKYLGIGPGAHSYNGTSRRWCEMTVEDYVTAPRPVYGSEILTPDDMYNELVMTSLRCSDGISPESITSKAGDKYTGYFLKAAGKLVERRLLQTDGCKYWIDPKDFLTSDSIISSLFSENPV